MLTDVGRAEVGMDYGHECIKRTGCSIEGEVLIIPMKLAREAKIV